MKKSKLYGVAGLAVSLLVMSGATRASAQAADAEQACTPDVMRLCNEFVPDRLRITACLKAKRRQLSPECSAAISPKAKTKKRRTRHR
jgi:hypothetical protein